MSTAEPLPQPDGVSTEGGSPEPEAQFTGTGLRPPKMFVFCVVAAVVAALMLFGLVGLGPNVSDWVQIRDSTALYVIMGIAVLVVLVSYFSDYRPQLQRRRREKRLFGWGLKGTDSKPGYFRLGPYEDNPDDRKAYARPDNAHKDVLKWLKQTERSLVYLTGCGKSSLLNAFVLPELREKHDVQVLRIRSFANTLDELRTQLVALSERLKLYKSNPDWVHSKPLPAVIERLIRRWKQVEEEPVPSAIPFRLLIVLDQFEELIILHGLQDGEPAAQTDVSRTREGEAPAEPQAAGDQPATPPSERVAAVRDVLKTLNDDPIEGVKVVLALRSDYRTMLTELDLPSINEPHIQREVGAFTRAQAGAILGDSERTGFKAGEKKLQSVLSEAAIVDDHRGMIRPIVINMLGRVLQKHTDAPDLPAHEEGRLLSKEVLAAVEDADVKEHAARILDPMLTDAGTKQPQTVGSLAESTGLDVHIIEGALFHLAETHTQTGLGLVRRITDASDATDRVWEVSHDFIARLLSPIIRSPSVTIWQRVRPLFSPTIVVLWLAVSVGVFNDYRRAPDRIRNQLAELTITLTPIFPDGYLAIAQRSMFPLANLQSVGPLLAEFGDVRAVDIRNSDFLTSVDGLQCLTSLEMLILGDSRSLTSLDALHRLTGLKMIELSYCTSLTSVAALQDLTELRTLNLTGCTSLTSVAALKNLTELRTLNLADCDSLKSLDGLQGLKSLVALDVSGLSPEQVQGLEKLTQLQSLRWRDIEDLSELPSLPALKEFDPASLNEPSALSDFEPLTRLPGLEVVYTYGFSDEQVAKIRKLLPDVTLDDSEYRTYRYPPPEDLPPEAE